MRFAKEIACNFLDKDCSNYDFFYTIKAESPIIAGPSAGAAASTLTVALLDNLPIDESVAITGTINSGGLIGHVGGIKEKIEAGAAAGLRKVLIPQGETVLAETEMLDVLNQSFNVQNNTNLTEIDAEAYGRQKGIIVKEVIALQDSVFELTGKKFQEENDSLVVDQQYVEIMKKLAVDLCNRSAKLNKDVEKLIIPKNYSKVLQEAINLTEKGKIAFDEGKFYTSASYCFGANVKYSFVYMISQNFTSDDIRKGVTVVRKGAQSMEKRIAQKKVSTITDLEAYAAIRERLLDAELYLNRTIRDIANPEDAITSLAYASERVYSAFSWYEFFKHIGKQFDLNEDLLKESCQTKIAEAEERYQYVKLLFPSFLTDTRQEIDYAYDYLQNDDYELCLFKASMAHAQADIVLNLVGLDENTSKDVLNVKLDVVKANIIKDGQRGIFPIMAYSYYEYAQSLSKTDLYSALLYTEYALELANFNLYFDGTEQAPIQKTDFVFDQRIGIFILGVVIGIVVSYFIFKRKPSRKKRKS